MSGFSCAIAEKSLVKDEALIDGKGAELEPELGLPDDEDAPLLPHAEAARASPATIDVRTTFLLRRSN